MSSPKMEPSSRGQELPMYLQRPSSGRSQDIRHVLARTFRDLYTRDVIRPDTLENLKVSKGSDDPYHEQYVENLQKVYTEWQQRMDEIAMLERHIMQAQARAMSADERELNKASMSCGNYKELGLPPVRAHFKSCIDTELLRNHYLLTPADYLVQDPMPVPPPKGPRTPAYARETFSFHNRSIQDKTKSETPRENLIKKSSEFEISQADFEIQKGVQKQENKNQKQIEFPKKYGWKEFMSEDQREADRKFVEKLQAKVNFMRNPRHLPPTVPPSGKSLLQTSNKTLKQNKIQQDSDFDVNDLVIFQPFPPVVEFTNYKIGEVYEITLELKNVSTVMRQCRVLPPSSNIFSVGLGQFPGESSLVAPGMSCKYGIRFTPSSLRDYDDSITVQTQPTYPLVIPLRARRPPPVLTLPEEVDVGSCLVGGSQTIQLLIKNEGGHGKFCLMPRNKWPTASIRTVVPNAMKASIKQSPFEISPVTFELATGQTVILDVIFSPYSEKVFVQEMTIACDNCNISHFKLKGEGEIARVSLVEVEMGLSELLPGEFHDVSAKQFLRFEDLNPFTYTQKTAKIMNCTKTELQFQWMIYKPIMAPCFSNGQPNKPTEEERVPDMVGAFSVFPSNGVLHPSQTAEFKLTFAPSAVGSFHSTAHMQLQNVPLQKPLIVAGSKRVSMAEAEEQEDEHFSYFDVGGFFPFKDTTVLELEMKGNGIPLNVVLHPYALIIKKSVLAGTTVKKYFTMANHSYSTITFKWEAYTESYIIEVEPPCGDLDPGMAMDFEISVTGVKPGKISHTMLCHILHKTEPLHFFVEAEFKGPEMKIEQPSINFGLVRVGHQETRNITIINMSEVMVKFDIEDYPDKVESGDDDDNQEHIPSDIKFSETSGELEPFGRKTITLTFSPTCACEIRRICVIKYGSESTCSIALFGEAQNPVVCFLECQKFLPDVYLEVPAVFSVTLHNQTLLSTTFTWGKAFGPQCNDCQIEVLEKKGELKSWQQKEVSIVFTALKPVSFSEIIVPCHIGGQKDDIYISINCNVQTLSVSYKVSTDGQDITDNLHVDFENKVGLGEAVKRFVHICNNTAISAPFSVTVENFIAPFVSHPDADEVGREASQQYQLLRRTPNACDPFSKMPAKVKQDYNKKVLGKKTGAAFVICPSSGQLQPFGEQIIEVSAHSDMWGNYHDNLIFRVGELEEVKIPVDLKVSGCPLSFQVTGNQPGLDAILRFGSHVSGSGPIKRHVRINNSSPFDIRVDWQVYKRVDDSDRVVDFITYYGKAFPLRDIYGTEISTSVESETTEITGLDTGLAFSLTSFEMFPCNMEKTMHFKKELNEKKESSLITAEVPKVVSCCLRPHNGVKSTSPFSIKPTQMVVPANGSYTAEVNFAPLPVSDVSEEMDYVGYAEGFLSVDFENEYSGKVVRPEAYDIEQLKINFMANLKPAVLTVEELDDDGMSFTSAVSDIMKDGKIQGESRCICSVKLSNNCQTPLTFKMKTNQPFMLVDLDPSSTDQASGFATETLFCTLKPRHCIVSTVAFQLTPVLLCDFYADSRDKVVPEIKMNFEDELSIEFLNGIVQKVPLHASVALPQLEVSKEFMDFGMCLVGQTRELEMDIINIGMSSCYWKCSIESLSETCDDDTFQIQPREGRLDTQVGKNRTTVKISFTAK